jgi:hypothetical protein
MCFLRNAALGQYNGSRKDWRLAYRNARLNQRIGIHPDPTTTGLVWKAALIVSYERAAHHDLLMSPLINRIALKRIIDEIMSE